VRTRIINLTAHTVVVLSGPRELARFSPSGSVARVNEITAMGLPLKTDVGEVPLTAVRYSCEVSDLPEPQAGVLYLVSRVLAAAIDRDDLVFPCDEVRDSEGRIVGCRSLGTFAGAARA